RMFDAIVSDIEMPDMDGLGFVRAIRAAGPWANLPVIALTATTGAEAARNGLNAGFTEYVGKFERGALLACLQQHLSEPATL
ncbi:MAG TPA: response regulator, partial [Rhodopila sp.]|nr:response regulator [Rhodopila sp.]